MKKLFLMICVGYHVFACSGADGGWARGVPGDHASRSAATPLSFAVAASNSWPELYRAANISHAYAFRHRERNTFGTINLAPEQAGGQWRSWTISEENTLTSRRISGVLAGNEKNRFSYTLSRLSPAVLFYSTSPSVKLFSDMKIDHYLYRSGRETEALYEEFGKYRGLVRTSLEGKKVDKDLGPPTERYSFAAIPERIAFCDPDGNVKTHDIESLAGSKDEMGEPWLLAWWGKASHIADNGCGWRSSYWDHQQGDKPRAASIQSGRADMPVLIVLQNNPLGIELSDDGLTLRFMELDGAGHIRMLLPFGGKPFDIAQTEAWAEKGLPDDVIERCRQWTQRLQYYPVSVSEEFRVEPNGDVTIRNKFGFLEIEDDWGTEGRRMAPAPGMLGLAMQAAFPIEFRAGGKPALLEDWDYFDYCGLLKAVEGEEYEYTIPAGRWTVPVPASPAGNSDAMLKAELERCVRETVESGHLAPLLDLSHDFAVLKFWWLGFGETVTAIAEAYPYLAGELQAKALAWLDNEFKTFPHLNMNREYLLAGARREPYPMTPEMIEINTKHIFPRDADDKMPGSVEGGALEYYRTQGLLRDMYGYAQYAELCKDKAPLKALAPELDKAFFKALDFDWFDWNLGAPGRGTAQWIAPQRNSYRFHHGAAYMNAAIAGALGYARLFGALGDKGKAEFGLYLAARMIPLRVAMAVYAAEYAKRGHILARNTPYWYMPKPAEHPDAWDVCQAIHVDEAMFIVGPDMRLSRHCIDLDTTAMVNITPEVARLLKDTAPELTGRYLDYVDKTRSMWFLVQATRMYDDESRAGSPELYGSCFLANAWITDKSAGELRRYLARSKFTGDLCYMRNLAALLGK